MSAEAAPREHVAAITILLAMHLGQVCMPGAAGIARRGVRDAVESAGKARISEFQDHKKWSRGYVSTPASNLNDLSPASRFRNYKAVYTPIHEVSALKTVGKVRLHT